MSLSIEVQMSGAGMNEFANDSFHCVKNSDTI